MRARIGIPTCFAKFLFLRFTRVFFLRATNFFFGDEFQKKSYIKKINLYIRHQHLLAFPFTLLKGTILHYTQCVDELLLGDSSSHGRSLSACQLLSACLPAPSICFGISLKRALFESVRMCSLTQNRGFSRNLTIFAEPNLSTRDANAKYA